MTQAPDPLIGQQLDAYQIQQRIGEGGMARVYKAYQVRLRREVAIKVIAPRIADDLSFKQRFEREAQLIASLQHPNIVVVYDFGEANHFTYLAMQYVGGGTLYQQLREGQPLNYRRSADYVRQVALALQHAHQRNIVHRDIKPQNMLISASDPTHLLLSDFGIARFFGNNWEAAWSGNTPPAFALTGTGQIIGTVEYMAPEQIQQHPLDARTDVYALGAVLFQLLTGYVPYRSTTYSGMLYQHVHEPLRPVRSINPDTPPALAAIAERALEKAPEARFQSAREMAQALEAVLASSALPPKELHTTFPSLPPQLSASMQHEDRHTTVAPDSGNFHFTTQSEITPAQQSEASTNTQPDSKQRQNIHGATTEQTGVQTGPRNFHSSHSVQPHQGYQGSQQAARQVTAQAGIRSRTPGTTRQRIQYIATVIMVVAALLLLTWRLLPLLGVTLPELHVATSLPAPFVETFQDHHLQWTEGNLNGLTATLYNGAYTLTTDNTTATHFPYPSAVANLPDNFTMTVQITQDTGRTDRAYGLAFHLNHTSTNQVTCYALVITSDGSYGVLRYDPGQPQPFRLQYGPFAAIHGSGTLNTLQAIVHGSSMQFSINGQSVQTNGATLSDATYTGGLPGLLVAGPAASFTVRKVQVSTP